MYTAESTSTPKLPIICYTSRSLKMFIRKINSKGTPGETYKIWFKDAYEIEHYRGTHTVSEVVPEADES